MGLQGLNGGRNNSVSGIDWGAVGGLLEAKRAVLEVLRAPVLYWKLYRRCPLKLPHGVLFYGPPGCGKTMLARATAQHCSLQLIVVSGPELLGKYIGSSEKAVRAVFARAHASGKPTVIFFDELEALAPKRGSDSTGVTDRVVNQLLTFLDGVEARPGVASTKQKEKKEKGKEKEKEKGDDDDYADADGDSDGEQHGKVYVMAATSRPDLVDKALLRPGRIERHLYCGQPDEEERRDVLMRALRAFPCDEGDIKGVVQELCSAGPNNKNAKAAALVSADLSALASSAFLLATHEAMNLPSGTDGDGDGDGDGDNGATSTVLLRGRHLRMAFASLRPSLAEKDMRFYRRVHGAFLDQQTGKSTSSSGGGSGIITTTPTAAAAAATTTTTTSVTPPRVVVAAASDPAAGREGNLSRGGADSASFTDVNDYEYDDDDDDGDDYGSSTAASSATEEEHDGGDGVGELLDHVDFSDYRDGDDYDDVAREPRVMDASHVFNPGSQRTTFR
jgi:peroxin-1